MVNFEQFYEQFLAGTQATGLCAQPHPLGE
jgi:hypothetical protein